MAEELIRLYKMEDELMIERGKTQKNLLTTDLLLFTARFPWVDAAYLTSYQTDLATADAFPLDNTVMNDVKVLTSDVNASVAEGVSALNILFKYAEITYPSDKARQRVFGQDQMEKARKDQQKMENLLEHAHSFANKVPYKTDLNARGYTQPEIDNLLTISDNIDTKNQLQESAKSNRPVTTQDRIKVYNIVFNRMRTVSTCAEVVFAGNAAKIEQYRANPPSGAAATTGLVKVTNTANGEVIENLTVAITDTTPPTHVTDAGGMAGPFDFGSTPPDTCTVTVTGAITPSPQSFNGLPVLDGEENIFDVQVTV